MREHPIREFDRHWLAVMVLIIAIAIGLAACGARYDGPGLLPPPGDPAWSDLGVNWKGETYIIDGEAYHVR